MTFLDCFLDDPLPHANRGQYDFVGRAVWINHGRVVVERYNPSIMLPLFRLTDDELEAFAAEIVCKWGHPNMDPLISGRHLHWNGYHNLFFYQPRLIESSTLS